MSSAELAAGLTGARSEHPTAVDGQNDPSVIYEGGVGCATNCSGWCGNTKIKITTRDISIEGGLICKTIENIDLWRIQDISYSRGCLECLCCTGRITIISSDPSCPTLVLKGLPDAEDLYHKIKDAKAKTNEIRVET